MERKAFTGFILTLLILYQLTHYSIFTYYEFMKDESIKRDTPLTETEAVKANYNHFYKNLGQINNDEILFYGEIPGGMIGFCVNRVVLWSNIDNSVIELSYCSSSQVIPMGLNRLEFYSNFFLGYRGTFTDVPAFDGIVYEELWPHIDLKFKATERGAKYEFLVKPDGNPTDIRITSTSYNLEIDDCSIKIQNGKYRDEGLVVLQEGQVIDSKFIEVDSNAYGFEIAEYDSSLPLLIDPLIYSTYMGAGYDDRAARITQDSNGDIIVAVYTESPNFPGTGTQFMGVADCLIYKINPSDYSVIFSIFVGGTGLDFVSGLDVDSNGDIYVSGETNSIDLPNNVTSYNGGTRDAFVIKLSGDGNVIYYSTYIGGSGDDSGWSIAADALGFLYVGGETSSTDFPVMNAIDDTLNGPTDAFIVKINYDTDIVFSSYLGGSGVDNVNWGINLDSESNVYLTGSTGSFDFPTTEGAFDTTLSGSSDCFISKISSTGDELIFSSFIGGLSTDVGYSIKVDAMGYVYVVGQTYSSDFPIVNPCCEYAGNADGFILKMSPTGESLIFSSFIGGNRLDTCWDLAFDTRGSLYIVGETYSDNFPTINPIQANYEDESEVFLTKLTNDGSKIAYSTYLGGGGMDAGYSVTLDSFANAFVVGMTNSIDFPVTRGLSGVDDSFGGGEFDSFLSIIPDMADLDDDELLAYEELEIGTDPYNNDTDSDLMDDKFEVDNDLNPLEDDSNEDADFDALSNLQEYQLFTDPNNADTDGDGYPDGWEYYNSFSPIDNEVPVMEIVLFNIPLVVFAVGVVVFLVLLRVLEPQYRKREAKKHKITIEEEEKRALEDLLVPSRLEEELALDDSSNIPREEE